MVWVWIVQHLEIFVSFCFTLVATTFSIFLRKWLKSEDDDGTPQPQTKFEKYAMKLWKECETRSAECEDNYGKVLTELNAIKASLNIQEI